MFTVVTAACVNIYWLTVFIKAVRHTKKHGKNPNVLPVEEEGLLSRTIMLPMLIVWNTIFWNTPPHTLLLPSLLPYAAYTAVAALLLSFYCWYYMGQHWRIGIDPEEKTKLITDGPFKYNRHPIYSLQILLMMATLASLQTIAAGILFCVHLGLFYFEAYREEEFALTVHKDDYREYMKRTGRFFPGLYKAYFGA